MKTQDLTNDTRGEIVIYQSEEGKAAIDVILQDETVWVTQDQMVALFGKAKSTISEHLKHIFEEGELDQNSVVRFFRTTAADGKSYNTAYYNLDVVISVGYRVHSVQGTRFRQWATQRRCRINQGASSPLSDLDPHRSLYLVFTWLLPGLYLVTSGHRFSNLPKNDDF